MQKTLYVLLQESSDNFKNVLSVFLWSDIGKLLCEASLFRVSLYLQYVQIWMINLTINGKKITS